MDSPRNRRQFLQLASVGAAASLAGIPGVTLAATAAAGESAKKAKFELGMASRSSSGRS